MLDEKANLQISHKIVAFDLDSSFINIFCRFVGSFSRSKSQRITRGMNLALSQQFGEFRMSRNRSFFILRNSVLLKQHWPKHSIDTSIRNSLSDCIAGSISVSIIF